MSKAIIGLASLRDKPFHTNTAKIVLFCLLRDVGEDGIVNTSASSIAKEIGVCEKTIRKVLSAFSEYGIIEGQNPMLSPNKVRYLGRAIKLNILEAYNEIQKIKVRTKPDIKSDIPARQKTQKFTPPTDAEVKAYVLEKGYHFDPASFIPFYESKGWKIGNQPMKDWEAACRTWEIRWKEKHGEQFYYQLNNGKAKPTNDYASRAESRRRMSALASEIVSRDADIILGLYDGPERQSDYSIDTE